jgi:hypothetical protein
MAPRISKIEIICRFVETHFITLDPLQYIVKDPEGEQKFNFSLEAALSNTMKESSQKLLSNYIVYATMSVLPLPEELRKIVSAAGGLVSAVTKYLFECSLL